MSVPLFNGTNPITFFTIIILLFFLLPFNASSPSSSYIQHHNTSFPSSTQTMTSHSPSVTADVPSNVPFASSTSTPPPSPLIIPVNSSSTSLSIPSFITVRHVPGARISVECKEPLVANVHWVCGIEQIVAGGEGVYEEEALWTMASSVGSEDLSTSQQERSARRQGFYAGPLELYHSNKVNRSDGHLFISALVRWQFHSAFSLQKTYYVHLWIRAIDRHNRTDGMAESTDLHRFVIPLALADVPSGSSSRSSVRNGNKAELLLRIDALFQYGCTYELKIFCMAEQNIHSMQSESTTVLLGRTRKRITFDDLFDEKDTNGCPDSDGFPDKTTSKTELVRRRAMASRWTGALHSVSFFPLHSSINVTFFGAPPSHCISAYRVQLWLLNALQEESTVEASTLIRLESNVYIGSAEFRNLFRNERMKYRVKVLPLEQTNGSCICEFERKCGCVQVFSDPFFLPNATSTLLDVVVAGPSVPMSSSFSVAADEPTVSSSFPVLPFLIAGLFLALTLLLLSMALLLFIVRYSNRAAIHKRRTLLQFSGRNIQKDRIHKELNGDKFGTASILRSHAVQAVLLVNAQPNRRNELERFARVLVKNGIRVFYDKWDRSRIERNLLGWVQLAVSKSQRTVLFYDKRAEQLLASTAANDELEQRQDDLFDQVFLALYQHLEPQKTMFVKWDESKLVDGRPLGTLLLSESVFLFNRDLKHIFASLRVQVTDAEVKDIERGYGRGFTSPLNTSSLAIRTGPMWQNKLTNDKTQEGAKQPLLLGSERKSEEMLPEVQEMCSSSKCSMKSRMDASNYNTNSSMISMLDEGICTSVTSNSEGETMIGQMRSMVKEQQSEGAMADVKPLMEIGKRKAAEEDGEDSGVIVA